MRVLLALLLLVSSACAATPAAPAPTPDAFSAVTEQARQQYDRGVQLYADGHYREALEAFRQAQLLSPAADPRVQEMLEKTGAQLTPTAVPVIGSDAPPPPVIVAATSTPVPVALPTPVPAPPPTLRPAPRPAAAAPGAQGLLTIDGGPSAVAGPTQAGVLYIADRTGSIWAIDQVPPTLRRPLTVSGEPVGLAIDEAAGQLIVAARAPATLLRLDRLTGRQLMSLALPVDPGEARVDFGLGLAFVLLPAQNALAVIDIRTFTVTAVTPGLDDVTGIALDPNAHQLYLSHLNGDLSVVNATDGKPTQRLKLSDGGLTGVATASGRAYAINTPARELFIVEPTTAAIARVPLPSEPTAVSASAGLVHLLVPQLDAIIRADASSGAEVARTQLPAGALAPDSLAPEDRVLRARLWSAVDGAAVLIDPRSGHVAIAPPP